MPKHPRRTQRRKSRKLTAATKREKRLREPHSKSITTAGNQKVQISFRARKSVYRQLVLLVARNGCTIQSCILAALRREGLRLSTRDLADHRRSR